MSIRCETRRREQGVNNLDANHRPRKIKDIVLYTSLLFAFNGSVLIKLCTCQVFLRYFPRETEAERKREIKRGMDGETEGDVESGGGHRGTERRG